MEPYNGAFTGQEIDEAVDVVQKNASTWSGKQGAITGLPGQVVGFNAEGNPVPQSVAGQNVVIEQQNGALTISATGEVYSTEETKIGTWIDGKPLYRIVFEGVYPDQQGYVSTGIEFPDSWFPTRYYGQIMSDSGVTHMVPHVSSSIYYIIGISLADNEFFVECGTSIYQNIHGKPMLIVLEYTKTTDQPQAAGDAP